jgi:hypothetical protein
MPPKPKTQNELAILYQVPQSTISKIKKKGYDVQDRNEFRAAMLAQNKRPPAWSNGCPWDEKPELDPATDIEVEDLDMEQLRQELMNASDYDEARFIKTKIGGLKEFLQLSILERDHLPKQEVETDMIRISAGVRAGLNSLRLELPAVLEGFTAAQMKGKIDEKVKSIARLLADETSELYQQQEL